MKTYMRKVGKTLLFGLVILAIAVVVYMVVPKYQIQSVRVDDDYVLITKVNTLTGETNSWYERYTPGEKFRFINKIKLLD